jgi:hypothetical protein
MKKCVYDLLILLMAGSVEKGFAYHSDYVETFLMSVMASRRGGAKVVDVRTSFHGRRSLTLAHPTAKHVDDAANLKSSSEKDSDSEDNSSSSTATDATPPESIASRTSRVGSTTKSRSGPTIPDPVAMTTVSFTTSSSSSKTDRKSSSSSSIGMGTNSTKANSATTVLSQPTDPGEPAYDERAFPTVYAYTDDDSWNSNGYNMHRPSNPAVDDILQFLDDDSYKTANRPFPKEQDVPAMWPLICIGILVTATVVLCAMTAYKNYHKRKNYQQIPAALEV